MGTASVESAPMIILRNISLRRGAKVLLREVDLTIQPRQHLALTGANGCGKSSLFALLRGDLGADSGDIDGLAGMQIAAMAQEIAPSEASALDFLIEGNPGIARLRSQIAAADAEADFERSAARALPLRQASILFRRKPMKVKDVMHRGAEWIEPGLLPALVAAADDDGYARLPQMEQSR